MQTPSRLRVFGVAVTVFGCGWVLMGLEIIGGRMLSPYFGSAAWVWGSVISVFLVALSAGYFAGGVLSQRVPNAAGLAVVILAASASVVPVAFWYQPVSEWIADWELHERWGALIAATVLFLLPSVLLGMVSPYAIQLTATSLDTVGLSAGRLYAVSTLGSFLGCLLTSFYFILLMGIRSILLLSSGLLLLIAVWLLTVWRLGAPLPKELHSCEAISVAGDPVGSQCSGSGERNPTLV